MWYYLPLIFIPSLLVVLAAKWIFKHHISYKEWMFQGEAFDTGLQKPLITR